MTEIEFAWTAMGAASLTIGVVHLFAWSQRRQDMPRLFLGLTAAAIAVLAYFEHRMAQAQTTDQYLALLRASHAPLAALLIGMCAFVRWQFPHSSRPLFLAAISSRAVVMVINFLVEGNFNFSRLHALERVSAGPLGTLSVPVGDVNPMTALGQFSVLLIVAFLAHALFAGYRAASAAERSRRKRMIGTLLAYLLFVNTWRLAVGFGWLASLDVMVPGFLAVLAVLGYELATDVARSRELAASLDDAESRRRAGEERMTEVLESVRVGLWTWHLRERRVDLTPLARDLLGGGFAGDFDDDGFLARVVPEDRARLRLAVSRAIGGGAVFDVEFRLADANGAARWVGMRGRLDATLAAEPERLFGVIGDISERKQGEELLRMVVDAAPTAMLMVAADGSIVLSNQRAVHLFGYPPEELVGLSVDALVPAARRDAHAALRAGYAVAPIARPMAPGRELAGRRKDGNEVPIEVELNPLRRENTDYVLASISDISERRRAERDAALHRDELAHLSRVALLSELSGSLAHELNQPLTAILSNAQAAQRFLSQSPPALGEVEEILANIVESDKRAGEVIRRLRAMLRKEAGDARPVDVNEVVGDVLKIIRSDLLNRSTAVHLQLDPGLPPVLGDPVPLQQVLLNLLMNACDAMAAMPREGRHVTVTTSRLPDGDVALSVRDTGTGIPEPDLQRIFSPFVTSKSEGLGLGLSMCATIVGAHRGRIWAENNPDAGATLHVALPALD